MLSACPRNLFKRCAASVNLLRGTDRRVGMVKTFEFEVGTWNGEGSMPKASYVLHSDYLKLENALREALDALDMETSGSPRIAELRKEFDL